MEPDSEYEEQTSYDRHSRRQSKRTHNDDDDDEGGKGDGERPISRRKRNRIVVTDSEHEDEGGTDVSPAVPSTDIGYQQEQQQEMWADDIRVEDWMDEAPGGDGLDFIPSLPNQFQPEDGQEEIAEEVDALLDDDTSADVPITVDDEIPIVAQGLTAEQIRRKVIHVAGPCVLDYDWLPRDPPRPYMDDRGVMYLSAGNENRWFVLTPLYPVFVGVDPGIKKLRSMEHRTHITNQEVLEAIQGSIRAYRQSFDVCVNEANCDRQQIAQDLQEKLNVTSTTFQGLQDSQQKEILGNVLDVLQEHPTTRSRSTWNDSQPMAHLQRILRKLEEMGERLTGQELQQTFEEFAKLWVDDEADRPPWLWETVARNFGLQEVVPDNLEHVDAGYRVMIHMLERFRALMESRDTLLQVPDQPALSDDDRVLNQHYMLLYQKVHTAVQFSYLALKLQHAYAHLPRQGIVDTFNLPVLTVPPHAVDGAAEKRDAILELQLHLYADLSRRNWRRVGNYCFVPISTPEGYFTNCFAQGPTIEEYVREQCLVEKSRYFWEATHRGTKVIENVCMNLEKDNSPCFPALKRNRFLRSTRNGIIHILADPNAGADDTRGNGVAFYPYEDGTKWPDSVDASLIYIDQWMDPRCFQTTDPMSIPTPCFDKLFRDQGFTLDEMRAIFIMLGRFMFPLNLLDRAQVALDVIGIAGTGKSLLSMLLCSFYDANIDVFYFNRSGEDTFGLQDMIGKLAIVANEWRAGATIAITTILQLIEGARVSVARKFKNVANVDADLPIMFNGNSFFATEDDNDSLLRRIILVRFNHLAPRWSALKDALEGEEKLNIFVKITRLYRKWAAELGQQTALSSFPPYFQQQIVELRRQLNPQLAFLLDESQVLLEYKTAEDGNTADRHRNVDLQLYARSSELFTAFSTHLKGTGHPMRGRAVNFDMFSSAFAITHISRVTAAEAAEARAAGYTVPQGADLRGICLAPNGAAAALAAQTDKFRMANAARS